MNNVEIIGTITKDFTKENTITIGKEELYSSYIKSKRKSGTQDIIKVVSNNELLFRKDDKVKLTGKFHSYNDKTDTKCKTILYVFIEDIQKTEEDDNNVVLLNGYICKKQNTRKTPLGKTITDVIIAVNTTDTHSDYIPCVFWNKDALKAGCMKIGDEITIKGRCQSREYQKIIDGNCVNKTAYEISVLEILS